MKLPRLLAFSLLFAISCPAAEKPLNVVFIMADDLGWSDTTLFGTTRLYKTPNIERLAKRGMTFTRAYSASPLCSPTRASVLTGLSPARHGITAPNCHLPAVVLKASVEPTGPPGSKATNTASVTRFDTKYYTLAEALKDAGYATGHFGKWHLGPEPYSPLQHGFDVDVPHWAGPGPAGSFVAPWQFKDFDPDPGQPHQHIEDRMAREATVFLETHKDAPFFLNYWMFSVHAPFDAKKDLIEKYRSQLDPADPQRSPTYAAMVESMDDAVGTLLDTLDRLALTDHTVIIFTSDNGGNMYNEVDGTTPTSNAPLRGGKASMFEGGVRVPLIVAWPGHTKPGSRTDVRAQSEDFYPTILEMTGRKPQEGQKFDGASLVAALDGDTADRGPAFNFFPHNPPVPEWIPPSVSIHEGDWKLLRIFHGGENGAHRYQLYNLKDDIGEQKDLSAAEPERVRTMDAKIEAFLTETGAVVPVRNPKFDPAQYHPEREGVPAIRKEGKKPKGKVKAAKPVRGWTPEGDASLTAGAEGLVIKSVGADPHISAPLAAPAPAGTYTVEMTLTSGASGDGQFFWQEAGVKPPFFRDRSTGFPVAHDGQPHELNMPFTAAHPVVALRLDPSAGPGTATLRRLTLKSAGGDVVQAWDFTKPEASGK